MTKIHQVLAVEKGVKRRTHDEISQLHHTVTRDPLLSGQARVYKPRDDQGEQLPPESMPVRVRAGEVLSQLEQTVTRLFDITLTKDVANLSARADVKVDDQTVLPAVPVTTLLFLEKQLTDLRTFFRKLPVLEPGVTWTYDETQSAHKAEPVVTTRTKKVPRNHVKYDATKEHPAQVEVFTEDVILGEWTTTRYSGALPKTQVDAMVKRVDTLLDAVKVAREEANAGNAEPMKMGEAIFDFLYRS